MSRSYKKVPILKVNRGGRSSKRIANKKVRKAQYLSNGRQYKKVYQTYDIYSEISFCTWEEFKQFSRLHTLYPTQDLLKQAWRQCYFNK